MTAIKKFLRRSTLCVVAIAWMVSMMGCQVKGEQNPAQPAANFDFALPENYQIAELREDRCTILKDDAAVGGIVCTYLNHGSVADIDQMELIPYLDTFAPVPLICEYFAMFFSDPYDHVAINLKVSDPENGTSSNYHHYLFEWDSNCYDLWLEDALLDAEEQRALLDAVNGQSGNGDHENADGAVSEKKP